MADVRSLDTSVQQSMPDETLEKIVKLLRDYKDRSVAAQQYAPPSQTEINSATISRNADFVSNSKSDATADRNLDMERPIDSVHLLQPSAPPEQKETDPLSNGQCFTHGNFQVDDRIETKQEHPTITHNSSSSSSNMAEALLAATYDRLVAEIASAHSSLSEEDPFWSPQTAVAAAAGGVPNHNVNNSSSSRNSMTRQQQQPEHVRSHSSPFGMLSSLYGQLGRVCRQLLALDDATRNGATNAGAVALTSDQREWIAHTAQRSRHLLDLLLLPHKQMETSVLGCDDEDIEKDEDDSSNTISLPDATTAAANLLHGMDRKDLEEEEQMLIAMANAPFPILHHRLY
jgi:hypothetical protein